MEFINNINNCHFDKLKNIFSDSDSVIIVSPFLSESFEMSPLQDILTLKNVILYTTLKSNSIESIDKVLALNNFVEFCKINEIEYKIRIDNNLHAKIYVTYKNGVAQKAIISSANFTNKGLKVNHEVGVIIDEAEYIRKIINEVDILPFDELSEDALEEIFKKLDDYKNIKKATELPNIDLDFSSYFSKSNFEFNRAISEIKYFIKPVGNQENPFPVTSTYAKPIEKLYFSKRYPRAVTTGSIMICYAVGDGRAIGYYEVISDVKIDVNNGRYPYYVEAKNLNIQYSKDWTKYSVHIIRSAHNYLGLNGTNALIFNGNKTLGALNFGSDKIRLNADFANYLITEIEKCSNKSLTHISCPLNKYQQLIAKELISAAKDRNVKYYGELYIVSENYYNHETIGNALGEISNLCIKLNLPLLSSIAVSKDTKMPGFGFNKTFNKQGIPELEFCIQEMKRVHEFENWDCLLEYLK